MGRKSKTDIILKNLDTIKSLKANGATDLQIAEQLNICPATWYKYLKEIPELQEIMEDSKIQVADKLEGELFKKSLKHILTTTRTITKNGETITEVTEKEIDGDTASLIFLLKNYAPDKWSNDWLQVRLKQKELELKERIAEKEDW